MTAMQKPTNPMFKLFRSSVVSFGVLFLGAIGAPVSAADMPIFDAHVHYSHDAWQNVPPKDAIALMRKAGVRRALVSSSDDDGNVKLYAEAPELILPSLRPYRKPRRNGELGSR